MVSGSLGKVPISPGLFARYAHIKHHKKHQKCLYPTIWVKVHGTIKEQIGKLNTDVFTFIFLSKISCLLSTVHICNFQNMFNIFIWMELCLRLLA